MLWQPGPVIGTKSADSDPSTGFRLAATRDDAAWCKEETHRRKREVVMTEAEWMACNDPQPMLDFLRGKASERKLRLFACAWCRRQWQLLTDEVNTKAVEIAEDYADGICNRQRLAAVRRDRKADYRNRQMAYLVQTVSEDEAAKWAGAWDTVSYTLRAQAYDSASLIIRGWMNPYHLRKAPQDRDSLVALLRDLLGNPFRPVPFDLTWLTSTVTNLTQTIYADRSFDHLPILADALEDAGCANADILNHSRGPGEHVRGCWVVDLLLGKN